jgi:hypothetical protein
MSSDTITLIKGQGPLVLPQKPHLRLASGNFWPEEVDGREKQLTAGLFIIDTRTTPSKQDHVRVHASQVVEVDGARLEILEVRGENGQEAAIHLKVR